VSAQKAKQIHDLSVGVPPEEVSDLGLAAFTPTKGERTDVIHGPISVYKPIPPVAH
jgi:hypothetical protein